jgi:hypothetical protein
MLDECRTSKCKAGGDGVKHSAFALSFEVLWIFPILAAIWQSVRQSEVPRQILVGRMSRENSRSKPQILPYQCATIGSSHNIIAEKIMLSK